MLERAQTRASSFDIRNPHRSQVYVCLSHVNHKSPTNEFGPRLEREREPPELPPSPARNLLALRLETGIAVSSLARLMSLICFAREWRPK